ncbi:MAG: rhomboid family intramembrane serine protease [Longimicrobiales bacterium]
MSFGMGGGLTLWVKRLIIANFVVWLLQLVSPSVTYYMQFIPGHVLTRPWTPLTYMFAHDPGGFGHILFNMLALFFFGPPLEARWGSKEFLKYYLICGLGGAALSFVFLNAPIIGASAAVYGVMLAFAMNWPDAPILIYGIFPIPAKYLVGFAAVMSLVLGVTGRGAGVAHFAHLGGFAAGFLYLKLDRRGGGLFTNVRKMVTRNRMNVVAGGGTPERPGAVGHMRMSGAAGGSAGEAQILSDLDKVLDKISTQGMSSLTREERELLDQASRRYRQD